MNGYFEEINGNKYLTLVPTNENKTKTKKKEELWIKIRDLIRSVTKNSDDYDEKYIKIKFNSDDELPLNKTIEIPSMIIVVRAVFHENNKYYPQAFLDECLCKLKVIKMIYYDKIDISEIIDVNKTSTSKECDVSHYRYFLNWYFLQNADLTEKCQTL